MILLEFKMTMQGSKFSLSFSTSYLGRALSLIYLVFMSFGNFFRFLNLPVFRDNILVSEAFLYLFAFFYLISKKINKSFLQVLLFSGIILASTAYGAILHGKDLRAFLFAMRLIGILCASYALGDMFWKKYGYDIQKFLRFFLFPFVLWIFFGFIIYFAFPSLANFWLFLKEYNIVFNGDPHIRRFVTVIFDPNIYGAIVFLPILASFMLYRISQKMKYLFLTNAFMVTAVLSWSRSGIATVCILLMVMVVRAVLNKRTFFSNKIFILNVFMFSCFLFLLPILCYSEFQYFYYRSFNVVDDVSALCRLNSFQNGLSILQDYPLLGIGYNFLTPFLDGLNFLDSSILGLVVCFGIIPFSIIAFIAAIRFFILKKQLNRLRNLNSFVYDFCSIFLCYIFLVVFFSSNFNNILLFSFWMIPSLSCLIYIGKMTQHRTKYEIKEKSIENCIST